VRVWDTSSGQRLHELRRGAEPAEIQCLSFDADCSWLLVSSDHGTVHIFRLADADTNLATVAPPLPPSQAGEPTDQTTATENPKSNFAFLSGLLPKSLTPTYIQSQWSFAQFRLPGSEKTLTRSIAAFGQERNARTFLVVSADGTFFKCSFDTVKGGECSREDWQRFLVADEED